LRFFEIASARNGCCAGEYFSVWEYRLINTDELPTPPGDSDRGGRGTFGNLGGFATVEMRATPKRTAVEEVGASWKEKR